MNSNSKPAKKTSSPRKRNTPAPAPEVAVAITAAPEASPRAGSKAENLIALLSRSEGATIAELGAASGWLPHSVRGFLAGTLKKKYGLAASSEKEERGRVYRVSSSGGEA